ncbi:FtsX-like permease family protein, partial [Nocardioides sp.]|uniref:FtsX-like permease family protein n=1 Tax=Nocardioides sp. TaxID=35761 RepID=UPI0027335FE3
MSGPRGWVAGWRPVLRLARRDALRARGRSILVLVMIALPVLGVVAADIVIRTVDVSGAEALERRMGAADAVVSVDPYAGDVAQTFDPDRGFWASGDERTGAPPGPDDVRRVLGRDVRTLERHVGSVRVTVDKGSSSPEGVELDLLDPLAAGLFDLTEGRLPEAGDEVAVNGELARRGPGLGEVLDVAGVGDRRVVGLVESTSSTGYPFVVGGLGSLGLAQQAESRGHQWLIDGGPVTWDEVRALNTLGAVVLSRAVLEDPPPSSELPEEVAWSGGTDGALVAIIGLIVAMALLEIVLLAGPAFAVTARRQARTIALMTASGATPAQARRVVLANALVLGSAAAVAGVVLGVVAAAVALPIAQRFSGDRFGPFEVAWVDLTVIGLFGLLSAFLAAMVPAWIASRQDVVAVLAGRRGDRRPSLRSPLVGVLLLAGGVASAAYGALTGAGGEIFIAAAAIPAVLGMILLVAPVLVGLARLSRPLPLTLRYAVRDSARHRTRTVPAVA